MPDEEYGWGLWGTNREHYLPSPAEIKVVCQRIREVGYFCRLGKWRPPWDAFMEEERRVECYRTKEVPELEPIPMPQLGKGVEEEECNWYDGLF